MKYSYPQVIIVHKLQKDLLHGGLAKSELKYILSHWSSLRNRARNRLPGHHEQVSIMETYLAKVTNITAVNNRFSTENNSVLLLFVRDVLTMSCVLLLAMKVKKDGKWTYKKYGAEDRRRSLNKGLILFI